MKDHDGDIKAFIHLSEAWYGPSNLPQEYVDEVTIGHFAPDGSTSGEMQVRWYEFGLSGRIVPKLECFDDGWHSLSTFTDLLAKMGELDDTQLTPKEFCALLTHLGFEDRTPRVNPHTAPQIESTIETETERVNKRNERLLTALRGVQQWFRNLEDGTDPDDPLRALRAIAHAPVHAIINKGLED